MGAWHKICSWDWGSHLQQSPAAESQHAPHCQPRTVLRFADRKFYPYHVGSDCATSCLNARGRHGPDRVMNVSHADSGCLFLLLVSLRLHDCATSKLLVILCPEGPCLHGDDIVYLRSVLPGSQLMTASCLFHSVQSAMHLHATIS